MASEWKETTLGTISIMQSDKVTSSGINIDNYISTENMLSDKGGVTVASGLPNQDKYLAFRKGDVLFSNIRTYFKKVWKASFDGAASNDVIVFRSKNESELNSDFLFYLISDERFIEHTVKTSKGTKMPRGDKSAMKSYELKIPKSTDEQKAIAQILGSLDEKIELNRQMNRTLEQMAQTMFKSWFVDFAPVIDNALEKGNEIPEELQERAEQRQAFGASRKPLPDHIQKLFPSEFEFSEELNKMIPKGWSVGCIGNFVQAQGGFAFKSSDFTDRGYPVVKIKNIQEDGTVDLKDIQYFNGLLSKKISNFILNDGDVVMAMTGATVCKSGLVVNVEGGKALLNQRVARMVNINTDIPAIFFSYIAFNEPTNLALLIDLAAGSAQPNISSKQIESLPCIVPNKDVLIKFDNIVQAYFTKIIANTKDIRHLQNLRDTLLPKLISGEVRVDEIELIS